MHIYNVLQSYSSPINLSESSFPIPVPQIIAFLLSCLFYFSFQFRLHMRGNMCNAFLSESGLFCLTCWHPVLSIFMQMPWFHPYLWLNNTTLCTIHIMHIHIYDTFFIHSSVDRHLG
jgi:hypothetical protein